MLAVPATVGYSTEAYAHLSPKEIVTVQSMGHGDPRTASSHASSTYPDLWGPEHSATDNPSPNGPTPSKGLSGRRPISYTSRIDESETYTLEDIFTIDRSQVRRVQDH